MKQVYGLDLSLTSTGIASSLGWSEVIKPPAKLRGHDRMAHLKAAIFEYVKDADLVVVEGPSYGSVANQRGHHERAGLWWLITHALWLRNIPTAVAPPKSVKKYICDKGNASKDDVLVAVCRRFPTFAGDNNSADAMVLAALGTDHLGIPMVAMPQTHRAALAGVEWPDLGEARVELEVAA